MNPPRPVSEILPGSEVVSADGKKVGRVINVTPSYVLVERGLHFPTDVHVPLSAVASYDTTTVRLNLTAKQTLAESWETAPAAGVGFLSTASYAPGIVIDGDVEDLGTSEDDTTPSPTKTPLEKEEASNA